jgi:hypothetical protein
LSPEIKKVLFGSFGMMLRPVTGSKMYLQVDGVLAFVVEQRFRCAASVACLFVVYFETIQHYSKAKARHDL